MDAYAPVWTATDCYRSSWAVMYWHSLVWVRMDSFGKLAQQWLAHTQSWAVMVGYGCLCTSMDSYGLLYIVMGSYGMV